MSRWSGLPASLDQRMRQLVVQLRRLKDHSGLSLAALAARTPYSKSSWERYLNGKKLPPRDAVEALCRLAGEPVGRLVALWELADAAWSGRGRSGAAQARGGRSAADDGPERATAPGTAVVAAAGPPADGEATPRPTRRLAGLAAGAGAGGVALAAALALWAAAGAGGLVTGAVPEAPEMTGCRARACDGKDPESMRCDLPDLVRTPLERTAAGGERVQLRYGTVCGAAWGRLRDGRIGDRVEVVAPGVAPRSVRVMDRFDAEDSLVTPMAAARGPEGVRLCLYPAGGGARECFSA
ncbi:XRE family transcriptional regulator [Streptomyces platensis]|uniref:helix-turn-helix domain-containing protein n=1 Tax=Streptomyces platensis TaxID=58346 RepID=UPI0022577825|nr:XRE family transcriptional regulator [Streptomyces platensis]MCX4636701.1 XRE family transcriptional regulator [Streptomyces platensis]